MSAPKVVKHPLKVQTIVSKKLPGKPTPKKSTGTGNGIGSMPASSATHDQRFDRRPPKARPAHSR